MQDPEFLNLKKNIFLWKKFKEMFYKEKKN